MGNPLVSVIIPTYNRQSTVIRAVGSVLWQTFKDYEIIVIDDGSNDGTKEALVDFPILYIYQVNHGSANARNHGIKLATGKYVAFLDSDDWFEPDKLKKQVKLMEDNPTCQVSHTSYFKVTSIKTQEIESSKFSGIVYPKLLINCPIALPTVMIRRTALIGKSFRELDSAYDLILLAELAQTSRVLSINESLTCISVGSNTWAYNWKKQKQSMDLIIQCLPLFNLPLFSRVGINSYWRMARVGLSNYKLTRYGLALYVKVLEWIMRIENG